MAGISDRGNSFFFFSLLAGLIALAIVILATLPMVIPAVLHGTDAAFGIGMTFGLIFLVAVIMLLAVVWALVSQLMALVMLSPALLRDGCLSRQVLGLITTYPGPFILYFVFTFSFHAAGDHRLCFSLPDLLRYRDSAHRNGDLVTDSCAPAKFHASVR